LATAAWPSLSELFDFAPAAEAKMRQDTLTIVSAAGGATHAFAIEVASTEQEKALGLMFRTALADSQGMLFPYSGERALQMWMHNTYIPLDMLFIRADGTIARIEVSTKRDGKVTRTEYYQGGTMVRVEEDTDGDGKVDKWETYDGTRLATLAFDLTHSGRPERRLVYGADGSVRAEVDRAGDGHFEPAEPAAPAGARKRQ
jgi:uncharacterized membrane protein (UPF0127 family)